MTEQKPPRRDPRQQVRQERLEAALRENLRRRKAQARARQETVAGQTADGSAATTPGAGPDGTESRD